MSRAFFRAPEFRLLFGYPSVTLLRGSAGPVATASIAVPDPPAALAGLAAEVRRARGRLTAVLPEAEVWRGLLDLPRRAPLARLRAARAAAAGGLAAAPDAVALVLGPPDAAGRTPVAAVRHDVLAEARAFLARAGLRPAAITGAGVFPGFAVPPRFRSRIRLAAPGVFGLARPAPVAALGAGVVLAVGLALALAPRPAPSPLPPVAATVEPAPVLAVGPEQPAAPALRPAPRPEGFLPPAATRAARVVPQALPAPERVAEPAPAPMVTMAARNVAFLPAPSAKAAPALRLAELTTARARLADVQPAPPFRRPAPAATAAPAAPAAAALTAVPAPMRRPTVAQPAPQATPALTAAPVPEATLPAAAASDPRPRPRPGAPVAVSRAEPGIQVASLAPAPDVAALVATALAAAATEPSIAPPVARPKAAAPAPQPVRAQPAPAKPAVQRQASPQPVRVQPAPVVVQRQAQPKPVRVRAAPAPKPVQTRNATTRPSRSNLVLVGIFGSARDRHALVQLPNGKMREVRAGDRVQGVQVAAIDADAVRLHGGGREALLRMPE